MPLQTVRIYEFGKPAIEHNDLLEIATQMDRLLGPALPDRQKNSKKITITDYRYVIEDWKT